jgi:hypothetical protein
MAPGAALPGQTPSTSLSLTDSHPAILNSPPTPPSASVASPADPIPTTATTTMLDLASAASASQPSPTGPNSDLGATPSVSTSSSHPQSGSQTGLTKQGSKMRPGPSSTARYVIPMSTVS